MHAAVIRDGICAGCLLTVITAANEFTMAVSVVVAVAVILWNVVAVTVFSITFFRRCGGDVEFDAVVTNYVSWLVDRG